LRRVVPYAIILAAAGWLILLTGKFDYDKSAGSLGPDAWPRLILWFTIGLCVFQITRLALFGDPEESVPIGLEAPGAEDDIPPAEAMGTNYMQAAAALASIALYLLALPYAGFFLSTLVFLTVFVAIAGYRRPLVILPVAAVLAAGFMFLFMRVIYVSLPIGIEPFSRISLLMMKLLGVS
jgi:putative tricarboxylic transport membrane protein